MSEPVTPNMGLLQPITGVTAGNTANDDFNANWSRIDQHDHTPGNGVAITPSAISVNSDFTLSSYNLTDARSTRFTVQSAALADASDIACLYFSGVDLWANDASGNQIQITLGGGVNATSSGISSGTASASFVSSVLVVNADTNKPANVQGASFKFGNNVTNSKFLTLSPPNAMAADYGLVLPPIPSVTSIMALDTSGNMTGAYTVDNSTIEINGSSQIAIKAQGVTQREAQIRTVSSTVTAGGVAKSASISFSTTSLTTVDVTNSVIQIDVLGNPVVLEVTGGVSVTGTTISPTTDPNALVTITNSVNTILYSQQVNVAADTSASAGVTRAGTFKFGTTLFLAAGTYSLKLRAISLISTTQVGVSGNFIAYEIK